MKNNVLEGLNAVVIGGSSGIGLTITQGLQEAGAAVAILGRNEEKLVRAGDELRGRDRQAQAFRVDVTVWGKFQEVSTPIEQEFGAIDGLVNSQGTTDIRRAMEMTDASLATAIATNLTSVFTASRLFRQGEPRMRGRSLPITMTATASAQAATSGI
jgi:2-deoxy-D-gluconate 3-dehydrogenase